MKVIENYHPFKKRRTPAFRNGGVKGDFKNNISVSTYFLKKGVIPLKDIHKAKPVVKQGRKATDLIKDCRVAMRGGHPGFFFQAVLNLPVGYT